MKATLEPILDVLGLADVRFRIPVFQRVYSWTERQCAQLFDDALRMYRSEGDLDTTQYPGHFLGTLIYLAEDSDGTEMGVRFASLIDGQQRMTTLTLLLTAMRDLARDGESESCRALAERIEGMYLLVQGQMKLILSDSDAQTLEALVRGGELPGGESSRFLVDNLAYFSRRLEEDPVEPVRFLHALERLQVVSVQLEEADAAQQVFESLNAKGKPLSTTDLLRNTLLLKYGLVEQERQFMTYWAPIDAAFATFAPEDDIYLDAALHAWLTEAAPDITIGKRSDLYQAYKTYLGSDQEPLEDILRSISERCLAFAVDAKSQEAREHIDWVIDKPKGLISERKVFGD